MPRKKVVIRKNIIVRIVIVIVICNHAVEITNVTITILTIMFLRFPDEKKRVKSYIYKYIIYIYLYI